MTAAFLLMQSCLLTKYSHHHNNASEYENKHASYCQKPLILIPTSTCSPFRVCNIPVGGGCRPCDSLSTVYLWWIKNKKSTIMFIIFRNFSMIEQVFFSSQTKRRVLISNKVVYTTCFTSCRKGQDLGS